MRKFVFGGAIAMAAAAAHAQTPRGATAPRAHTEPFERRIARLHHPLATRACPSIWLPCPAYGSGRRPSCS